VLAAEWPWRRGVRPEGPPQTHVAGRPNDWKKAIVTLKAGDKIILTWPF
jgi:ribosomal protein L23